MVAAKWRTNRGRREGGQQSHIEGRKTTAADIKLATRVKLESFQ